MTYNMYNKKQLEKALSHLGKRLELEDFPSISLIVCGGSALILLGLINRTTKDVDIVALGYPDADGKLKIKGSKPFPEIIKKAAQQVARDLGMEENWLNPGPGDLMKFGLPEGFMDRVQTRKYGKVLTIHFIGRYDQIHLKVYASVDQGPGRHVDDLLALQPDTKEIGSAVKWAMKHDPSEQFRMILKDMLGKIGYEEVAKRI